MEIIRYNDKCVVKQDKLTKEVEAEILESRRHNNLIEVKHKSQKIPIIVAESKK